ncbi:Damage-control phosphatase ARMT1 [Phytophthora ramorum]|uniref:Damage-control phosphatase ARMT1 n=1 Tax=Phytophthora ramorum TaxID=164328 RepID=UPI00309F57C1|nr:Damage-control phosphatase ARMT1 [Phytophthora ramorum]
MGVSAEFLARVYQGEEIFTNVPGTFANESYKSRLPGLVRDCAANNSERFSEEQCQRLLQLADDMVNDAVIPLPSQYPEESAKSPTSAQWETLLAGKGYTWQNSPWFMCEQYMFHLVLLLAEYYTTGIDPFHPSKVAELEEDTPWALLQTAVGLSAQEEASSQSHHDQLKRFMKLCLWGNKADGCYKEVKDTISGADASLEFDDALLLVDHSDKVISYLEQKARETGGDAQKLGVQYINDNSGTELLLDLALADHLLGHGWCGKVTFNVKLEPIYVSDATPADVLEHIAEMQRSTRTPEVQALGKRLADYVCKQQLVIRPDIFWNRYTYYWEMPTELQTRLAREATLVIIKGDLNYRRLLGDRLWPPSTPVEEAVPYFPTAFVSFRTLKSNPVVGIPADIVSRLEKEDVKWRYNGKRGTIQSVLTPASVLQ